MQRSAAAPATAMRMSDVFFSFLWQATATSTAVNPLSAVGASLIVGSILLVVIVKSVRSKREAKRAKLAALEEAEEGDKEQVESGDLEDGEGAGLLLNEHEQTVREFDSNISDNSQRGSTASSLQLRSRKEKSDLSSYKSNENIEADIDSLPNTKILPV